MKVYVASVEFPNERTIGVFSTEDAARKACEPYDGVATQDYRESTQHTTVEEFELDKPA